MTILYLADIRFPLERANGIQTMETCAALARRDHRVTLFVRPDTARPRRDPWTFYGVGRDDRLTIEQPAWLGVQAPQALRRLMYLRAALKRAHTDPQPDVVLTRDLGVADLLLSRRARGSAFGRAKRAAHPRDRREFDPKAGTACEGAERGGASSRPAGVPASDPAGVRGRAPAKVVYESHGYAPEVSRAMPALLSDGAPPDERKLRRLDTRERRVWQHADGYVTITAALAREMIERFGPRGWTATIPDGVRLPDGARLKPGTTSTRSVSEREPTSAFAVPGFSRAPLVAYAGHLYPWKGVDILIEAMRELPAARALIVGGHAAEPDLARVREAANATGVADRVEFTGFVPPSAVAAQLQRADVLVLPNPAHTISARYTSPLKLFEYMAAGRPIVASDLPAIREIIQDGRNGLLVAPGDPHALASAVRRLLDDRALAGRLAACAFTDARFYTWDRRAQRLEQVLTSVLNDRRGATP